MPYKLGFLQSFPTNRNQPIASPKIPFDSAKTGQFSCRLTVKSRGTLKYCLQCPSLVFFAGFAVKESDKLLELNLIYCLLGPDPGNRIPLISTSCKVSPVLTVTASGFSCP